MEGSLVQICIPIFNWTKWIGLELDRGSLPNILYSLIMMINTIVSNVAHQQCLLSSTIQDGEDGLIGRLIESCNAFAFTVGIHLAFFVTNRTQWNLVFKMLKDIQIGPEFVKKIPSASKTINIIGNALILWVCYPHVSCRLITSYNSKHNRHFAEVLPWIYCLRMIVFPPTLRSE